MSNYLTESFAQEVIDTWDYDFFVIKKIESMTCKCVDPTNKIPKVDCKLCLGLGKKIKIYRVKGASRESREFEAIRAEFPTATPKIFYVKDKLFIELSDLIVDKEDLYTVFAKQHHRGINGEFKFTRCVCPTLKNGKIQVYKNFKELLNKNGISY